MEFDSEIRVQGKPILLGVLGKTEKITKEAIHEKIIDPLMSVLGRKPDKVFIPSEGQSSAYISLWAERGDVDTQLLEADWRKFQRRAVFVRDNRIIKDSTHLLVFAGTKSKKNEEIAFKEVQKGKQVFLVEAQTLEFYEVVVEE